MNEIIHPPAPPDRRRDAHKGDFGHLLIIGGSKGMAGAPCLCGDSALRGGAGLVTVAAPESIFPTVAAKLNPCCMALELPENGGGIVDPDGGIIKHAGQFSAVALGPGGGRLPRTEAFFRGAAAGLKAPAVIDADGLNALAGQTDSLKDIQGGRVLTPHPGEMARLAGLSSAAEIQADRLGIASAFAQRFGVTVVLKGRGTIVTDGERYYINSTGNPGMATGGTGDALTGLLGALIAQRMELFDAAVLAVYIHGLAGDIAARRLDEISLTAADLIACIPAAFKAHRRR